MTLLVSSLFTFKSFAFDFVCHSTIEIYETTDQKDINISLHSFKQNTHINSDNSKISNHVYKRGEEITLYESMYKIDMENLIIKIYSKDIHADKWEEASDWEFTIAWNSDSLIVLNLVDSFEGEPIAEISSEKFYIHKRFGTFKLVVSREMRFWLHKGNCF